MFHMPFRDMTITLDDVSTLLTIPIIGNTVSLSLAVEVHTLLSCALAVVEEEACEELGSVHGCSIRLEWLWCRVQGVTNDCGNEVIRCSPRAYLLYLLRCTLFTDKMTS